MRILYYNWVPLFDTLKRGGGVRVYLENLVRRAAREGHSVTYLSAGLRHNLLRPGLRLRRVPDKLQNVREYEVVNSPILAPSHANFGRAVNKTDEQKYISLLVDFIQTEGPFDVIHLQNIEGLPADLFDRPADLNATRILLSLHNYNVLCQQVNLWYDEQVACVDYLGGRRCSTCVVAPPSREVLIGSTIQEIVGPIAAEGSVWQSRAFSLAGRSRAIVRRGARLVRSFKAALSRRTGQSHHGYRPQSEVFRQHRADWVRVLSRMTRLIAVSDRVNSIFAEYGVDPAVITTRYISTAFADRFSPEQFRNKTIAATNNAKLRLGFLGYMRRDKGFFFLLDAIEKLPPQVQARLSLKICAPHASSHRSLIERKLARLADWEVVDGYNHADLPLLLSDVDVGLVPVLWEDNMPQVGYEFVCHGVPLFVSDRGGVSELVHPAGLIFKAGDSVDFGRKLETVVNDRASLVSFWDHPDFPIMDWDGHWKQLDQLYNE